MRMTIGLVAAGLFGMLAFAATRPGETLPGALSSTESVDEGFVVHEWGTFTNFAGADGVQLEYRPQLAGELPGFVLNRARQDGLGFSKLALFARQRMETPVLYFYSDRPRTVQVRVDFPQGLLTEFYPPVRGYGPPRDSAAQKHSFLDWGPVHILPVKEFAKLQRPVGKKPMPRLPDVSHDDHYGFARETDAAIVEVTDIARRKHYEKFLFYRGLGNFRLPLELQALGGGRFQATNSGPQPVRDLFLVHVEHGQLYFSHALVVAAHGTLRLQQSTASSSADALGEEMISALTRAGLFQAEARSMVKTWRSSWFSETGTRLLYLVPERLTGEVLPLRIAPSPRSLVRVLVGRMEVLTPEDAGRLRSLIGSLGVCASALAEPLQSELALLGRFAEPALRHLLSETKDDSTSWAIRSILSELAAKEAQTQYE